MRRLESIEDEMRGIATYLLDDGRCMQFDVRTIHEVGLDRLMKVVGYKEPEATGRVDLFQHGRKVGTVPASFDPLFMKSKSYWYDVRPGDFQRWTDGKSWLANRTLGPGDLEAIEGFVWDRQPIEKTG